MIEVEILDSGIKAGILTFDDEKYIFTYDEKFLKAKDTTAISLTLPKQKEPFVSDTLHPFFSGLLAEGSLKELQCKKLKLDENDEFKRLIYTAKDDTIGSITIGKIL
jgi:serine/threonine-protein kinase HipA